MSLMGLTSCTTNTSTYKQIYRINGIKSECMVEEIEKNKEKTKFLEGKWVLEKMANTSIIVTNRPELEINLEEKRINGTGGCNLYFADIEQVNSKTLLFGVIGSTQKMCYEENIENEYFMLLEKTHYFQVDQENLILLNKENKPILTFKK
ncbi:hypothetical protein RCZ15_15540 [Capnocytophaga catalasegens]|uniref:DUF306 domain-containing protein n=2 Tax=Capnocytophaga catalasegens TaxID=1004260 RepID=A0AAV5AXE6_9FLAO|nr:hypothetical protein RCZ03_07330 [Capnocytophaga catalasegens]GJM50581.1 hypothetical protein RCZ15_15540 [Capnocytophaga catalasegens]GJM53588.1 hypothetical protein RCZ16_19040 [Capnocytophaga catalasegens]